MPFQMKWEAAGVSRMQVRLAEKWSSPKTAYSVPAVAAAMTVMPPAKMSAYLVCGVK